MDYVLNEDGGIKVTDGKPTVLDEGKEFGIDAIGANNRFTEVVTQRDGLKKDLDKVNTTLETFAGIDDPLAAIKAMQDVGSMGDKQQVELDTQRDAINKSWETKQATWETSDVEKSKALRKATIERDFATSKTVDGLTIPADIAFTMFGKQFNDDGTANDANGNPIYSVENPGQLAKGEDAIAQVIAGYANVAQITKADSTGGGANGGSDGDGNAKTVTRQQFDAMTPADKMKFSTSGGKVT